MSAHAIATNEAAVESKTFFGFWVYVMTDCVLFASLFATYAVLRNNTYGGPAGSEIFDLQFVLIETLLLLASSFVCGLALLAARRNDKMQAILWLEVTIALGAIFLTMELTEFSQLIAEGNSWQRSGFLSAFFTLVGTHGLHIVTGLLWAIVLVAQIVKRGFVAGTMRRLAMFGIFWHFLDIIWICIFTVVYLMGVI